MEFKTMEMTPTKAMGMLEKNSNNRSSRQALVEQYASDMRNGLWNAENGETIKVDSDGGLLDGQHRLMAVVESGVTVKMVVVTGLSPSGRETIDTGLSRTAGDILYLAGHTSDSTILATAAKYLCVLEERGIANITIYRPSKRSILAKFLDNSEGLNKSLSMIKTLEAKKVMGLGMATFFHYVFSQIDEHKADLFFHGLGIGTGLISTSPIYRLREKFLLSRVQKKLRLTNVDQVAFTIKAWNAYLFNRPVSVLRWKRSEGVPGIAGHKSE